MAHRIVRLHIIVLSLPSILPEPLAILHRGAVLELPEGLDEVAAVRKAAFGPDLAGLEPGGAEQLGGFFHPELLDILDGRTDYLTRVFSEIE